MKMKIFKYFMGREREKRKKERREGSREGIFKYFMGDL